MALLRACSFTNLIMLERSSVLWRCGTKSLCFCETRFIIYRMSTLHDHSQGCHIICVCVWVCVSLGTYKDAFKTSRKPRKPLHKGDSGGSLVTKLCPTLCDPMDCSPPGSSVRVVLFLSRNISLELPIMQCLKRVIVCTLFSVLVVYSGVLVEHQFLS